MGVELEKKYRLADGDFERLAKVLAEAGARFDGREFEENTIFFGAPMVGDGAAPIVRIRKTGSRTLLTYKRRVESVSDVKRQIEHEIEVSDAETTASILVELGLEPRLIYEKYRDTWIFRTVEIVLDELPFGRFMEIEGSLTGIREAEIVLAIEDLEPEDETYPRLTSRLGTKNGNVTEARFS